MCDVVCSCVRSFVRLCVSLTFWFVCVRLCALEFYVCGLLLDCVCVYSVAWVFDPSCVYVCLFARVLACVCVRP